MIETLITHEEMKILMAKPERPRITKLGNFYMFVSGAGGMYRRSNVYIFELFLPEVIKQKCLNPRWEFEIEHGRNDNFKGIKSKIVARHWLVAQHVHDGMTDRSKGFRARIEALQLAERLNAGEDIPPTWVRSGYARWDKTRDRDN
jgi:hypothetical protein